MPHSERVKEVQKQFKSLADEVYISLFLDTYAVSYGKLIFAASRSSRPIKKTRLSGIN
jgi:hypothetical protein